MQFHTYRTLASLSPNLRRFSPAEVDTILFRDPATRPIRELEREWQTDSKPYYRVWPGILKPLINLRLDRVRCEHVRLPLRSLCVELPIGRSIPWGTYEVATILLARSHGQSGLRIVALASDADSTGAVYELFLPDGREVEEYLPEETREFPGVGLSVPEQMVASVIRLVVCLCLVARDPELVVPRVLEADRAKWEQSHDIALVAKARRRHNMGWDIGREVPEIAEGPPAEAPDESGERTVSPHYRRAHPALVWTGEGRQVPRIVLRRGGFVKGGSLTQVPQGYYDDIPPCPYCLKPMTRDGARWYCEDCEGASYLGSAGHGAAPKRTGRVIRDPRGLS